MREDLETNLFGAWRTTQALLPLLRRSDHPRIVNAPSGADAPGHGRRHSGLKVSKVSINAHAMFGTELGATASWSTRSVRAGWPPTWVAVAGGPSARAPWASSKQATLPDDGLTGGSFVTAAPWPGERTHVA